MKYTKEQLQGMNDFELGYCFNFFTGHYIDIANLHDIMSLAFEHKICLITDDDGWIAFLLELQEDDEMEYADKNPLRAIACCLILVLQEKRDDNC